MHPSPFAANTSPPTSAETTHRSIERADRAYQGLTIAVMILLLGSLLSLW